MSLFYEKTMNFIFCEKSESLLSKASLVGAGLFVAQQGSPGYSSELALLTKDKSKTKKLRNFSTLIGERLLGHLFPRNFECKINPIW
jgi:hypothetical protein